MINYTYLGIFCIITLLLIIIIYLVYKHIDKLRIEKDYFKEQSIKLTNNIKSLKSEVKGLNHQINTLEEEEFKTMEKHSKIKKEKILFNPIYKGKKILIGNYDEFSSERLRRILRSFGIKVDFVLTGDEVIERIKNNNHYDIIFTNSLYKTGEFNTGESVLNYLRETMNMSIPIIVHSVYEKRAFISSGFSDYLPKPANYQETKKILGKYFN